jgi:hypothetical protein
VNEPNGWIKLHRKSLNSVWSNKPLISAFAHYCMKKAYWKPGKIYWQGKEIELQPGQFYTGRVKLSHETGLSQQNIRTAIQMLTRINFLTSKSTNKGSIITLLNYEYYQSLEDNQPANQPATNQQPTSNQPATNQQLTTDEEVKNLRTKEVKDLKEHLLSVAKPAPDPVVIEIFEKLTAKIKAHRPNHKLAELKHARRPIEAMLRVDKRDPAHILKLLDWYPIGQQYIPEIFSASALREKYEKLEGAFNRQEEKRTSYVSDAQRQAESEKYKRETEAAARRMFGGN